MQGLAWWEAGLLIGAVVLVLLLSAALMLWRLASTSARRIAGRIQALSWRGRLRLAGALLRDRSIPAVVRLIPALLVLYLALPIDLLPDFIPLLGQIDDVLVVIVGLGLMLRLTPAQTVEAHLNRLEAQGFSHHQQERLSG